MTGGPPTSATPGEASPSRALRAVPLVAAVAAAGAHAAGPALSGTGFHARELATFAEALRPGLGDLDGPPLATWVGRLLWVTGPSLLATRVLAGLVAAAVVACTARLARRAGGDDGAAALAAVCALVAPGVLLQLGAYSSAGLEVLGVALVCLAVGGREPAGRPAAPARDGAGASAGDDAPGGPARLGIATGVLLGLLLLTRLTAWWFVAGLALGWLVCRDARPVGAARVLLVALLVASPYLVSQALAGWPVADYVLAEHVLARGLLPVPAFLWRVVQAAHPLALPVLLAGLVRLAVAEDLRGWRPLLGLVLLPLAVLLVSHSGRPERLVPVYPLLFATGSAPCARWLARRGRGPLAAALVVLVLGGAVTAPLVVPLAPPGPTQAFAESADVLRLRDLSTRSMLARLGWEEMADAVLAVVDALPAEDRRDAVVLALDEAEAGALLVHGAGRGMPPVYSAHNGLFERPPAPGEGRVAVSLAWPPHRLDDLYAEVRRVGVHRPALADPQQMDLPLDVCREPRVPLAEAWPALRRLQAPRDLE